MHSRILYPRLAAHSVRTNARFYLPFLIVCAVVVAFHYDIQFLNMNQGMDQLPGSSSVSGLLAIVVVAYDVFSAFLFFYVNSFLMKRRQKELGLYSILGMDKRHMLYLQHMRRAPRTADFLSSLSISRPCRPS